MEQIKNIKDLTALQELYASVFGKTGTMTSALKDMKNMDADARAKLNAQNVALRAAFKERQTQLEEQEILESLAENKQDATTNHEPRITSHGKLHPKTQALSEISTILNDMGYQMRTGPEIEDDWHNFTALNTPAHHPARDMQDTFFMESGNVMRTQTSAIQIREMERTGAPIKIFGVGATYRKEMDATHSPMFGQIEGLWIDKNINMTDMVSDIREFLTRFFGREFNMRMRPSYFPFTEPSVEVDIEWKSGKWLEICGAGMVHPNVLRNCNINPDEFQGFAFGFGWDRMAMLKYGLNDIRKFYDGDVRWLKVNGF